MRYRKQLITPRRKIYRCCRSSGNDGIDVNDKQKINLQREYQGNGEVKDVPASMDNVVTVGSTDQNSNLSEFSNFGMNYTDIVAPGGSFAYLNQFGVDKWMNEGYMHKENILTTANNGRYIYQAGTSLATPKVSGVLALIIDKYHLEKHPDKAIELLYQHGTSKNNKPFSRYGHGEIDVNKALNVTNQKQVNKSKEFLIMAKLVTENISKRFKNQDVLKHINITLENNEVYGLLGINGAGKTTLMKIICGILQQDSGEILLDNQPMKRNDLHKVGSLIETPTTYNHLSAQDNLKIVCLNESVDFSEIKNVLSLVNLNVDKKKKVKDFSLGMKQRLGIAMALIKKPEILVLDEPSNGLDPYGIQELRELLKLLTEQGTSIIISSHILSEIQVLADHIGIIHEGELKYQQRNNKDENLEDIFFKITKGDYK